MVQVIYTYEVDGGGTYRCKAWSSESFPFALNQYLNLQEDFVRIIKQNQKKKTKENVMQVMSFMCNQSHEPG